MVGRGDWCKLELSKDEILANKAGDVAADTEEDDDDGEG